MRTEYFPGLTAFVCVAQLGSFAAAASQLGVTPGAVSQVVKKLEARLGVRLLDRTSRHVSLIESGRRFFELCAPHLSALEHAHSEIAASSSRPSGLLRLTMPRLVASQFIEPHLADFLVRYSEVAIELRTQNELVDLISGGLDAGVRLGKNIEKDMVAVPLVPVYASRPSRDWDG